MIFKTNHFLFYDILLPMPLGYLHLLYLYLDLYDGNIV